MDTIRIGVIGLGIQGQQQVRCFRSIPEVEVVAVCSRTRERADAVAAELGIARSYTDVEEMIREGGLDAVCVSTPDHLHGAPTRAALSAGLHVLLEKPMALSVDEAEEMVALAEEHERVLMVNFSHRHQVPTVSMKQRIDDGEFGDPVYAYARLNNTLFVPTQMLSWSACTALPHWLMTHELDRIRWFFGSEARRVTAVSYSGLLRQRGFDVADLYQATVVFENGAIANLESTWILPETCPFVADCKAHFVFTRGFFDIDHNEPVIKVASEERYQQPGILGGSLHGRPVGTVFEACRQFVDVVLGRQELDVTPRDALAVTRIACAIIESASTGEAVDL